MLETIYYTCLYTYVHTCLQSSRKQNNPFSRRRCGRTKMQMLYCQLLFLCMFKGDKTEFNVCYRVSIFTYTHNRQELNFELGIDSVTSDRKYYYWAIGTNRMQDKSAPATQPLTLPNVLEGIDLLHSNYWLFWFSFHCLNSAPLLRKHRCNNSYSVD